MAVREKTRADRSQAIGKRVKKLRDERGWSEEKLARKADLSRQTIRNVEAGVGLPKLETLELIADAFEVSLAFLLGEEYLLASPVVARSDRDTRAFLNGFLPALAHSA